MARHAHAHARAGDHGARAERPLVAELAVRDFRTIRELTLTPGAVCALVGDAQAGKSNLLAALRGVLDPAGAALDAGDVRRGGDGLLVRARLAGGAWAQVAGRPPALERELPRSVPPVLFLAAGDRATTVVGPPGDVAPAPPVARFHTHVRDALRRRDGVSPAVPALCLLSALEAACHEHMTGVVVLVEEPELYLRPQAQRWCSRLLRRLGAAGNQVIYATHSPAFLNVARMDELVFVERSGDVGTQALRPPALTPDDDFRVLSEFDAERAELFLARVALLVEGETEKLALPFVFAALGQDADREGISIVECGGKANLVLFARVCRAAGVPFVVLHDRDARAGRQPSAGNRALNERLAALAGPGRAIELAPDFESVSRLPRGGHKPERAWRRFATLPADRMPGELVAAARLTLELARPRGGRRLSGP
ncbi:AAA family ATPase [Baekduia soli]|uniref:AAA family ATPase n=1 Tax=Baekduia soli TaxID=496014 RepID=A0A5B8UAI0_9ACTN|nr:TOPRIM nucleotidyl transferase/hydrolase domain-containing protein [Baekduia soli]QEC49808.1 AAA family ATPase [Baekduia soli]